MLTFGEGQLVSVASVSIQNDRISAIYSVNNPGKIHADRQPHTSYDSVLAVLGSRQGREKHSGKNGKQDALKKSLLRHAFSGEL